MRVMRDHITESVVVLLVAGLLVTSAWLWLEGSSQPSEATGGAPYRIPTVLDTAIGEIISFEEAKRLASFEFSLPVHIPEGLSLVRLRGAKVWSTTSFDEIRLYYSDGPITADTSDVTVPGSPKLVVIITRWGTAPDENELREFMAQFEPIREMLYVDGSLGYGIDLGHFNDYGDGWTEPIPALIKWWKAGLRFEVRGMYPLEELLIVAESMA